MEDEKYFVEFSILMTTRRARGQKFFATDSAKVLLPMLKELFLIKQVRVMNSPLIKQYMYVLLREVFEQKNMCAQKCSELCKFFPNKKGYNIFINSPC